MKQDRLTYRLLSHMPEALAIVLLAFALVFGDKAVRLDNTYNFPIKYLEHNPDSLVINCFNLRKGDFNISLDYLSDTDASARILADNDLSFDVGLPAGEGSASADFSLPHPTDRFKVVIPFSEGQNIEIRAVTLTSGRRPIYMDHLLYAVLCLVGAAAMLLLREKWGRMDYEDRMDAAILLLLILAVNIPYYQKGLAFTADIRAHMQRMEGVMRGLLDGQLPVVVSPNMLNEFGELSFLYPDIFLYPFGILRILSVSMLTAYRLCMFLSNVLTVVLAYISFRLMGADRCMVILATLCIAFEPYRLHNVLARGSGAGNVIASAFLPLVVAGIYLVLKGDDRWWVLSVGMTGVMESHVMTMVILAICLVVLALCLIKDLAHGRVISSLLKSVGLALLMNAGFLLIFMKCYLTDWDSSALEWSIFTDSGYGVARALTNSWSLFEITALGTCIFLLVTNHDKKEQSYRLSLAMTIIGFVLYVSSWQIFPWDALIQVSPAIGRLTTMLQMPQRVLAVSSVLFISSIVLLASDGIRRREETQGPDEAREKENLQRLHGAQENEGKQRPWSTWLLYGIFAAVLVYGTVDGFSSYYSASYLMPDEVYGDHNSLPIRDYKPSGATEESWGSDTGYVSDEDAVESLSYLKYGTHIDYTYVSHEDGTFANLPLLYYEWYRAVDEYGAPLNLRKSDDGRVIVDLVGDGEEHEAHIWFDMGMGYRILWLFSLVFTIAFVIVQCKQGRRG